MNKQQKLIYNCLATILFVAAFVFFAFAYRGHLFNSEQYQLFLFTSNYFCDLFRFPGGLSAWLSRFFIQFFLFPVAGGLIYACTISGIQALCSCFVRNRTFLSRMASFIPALMVWAVMCREYVQINIAICVLICLGCALACSRSKYSSVLFIVLTPVLYWVCGFAAIIFVLSSLCTRKWWVTASAVAVIVALPFVLRPFVRFNVERLFKGFFYMKDPEVKFTWPWIAFATVATYVAIFSFNLRENLMAAYCSLVVAIAGGTTAIVLMSDMKLDEEMIYSNMARYQQWDRIIKKANRKMPMNYFSMANLNLALAMKGRLGEDMFKYVQPGIESLIPPYKKIHTDNLVCSDIFYYLALPSQSQRHMFECKESIPSMEKGSRMYQRLAQTNSINNQFAASHKYLDALSKTLFYRKWARDFYDYSEDRNHYRELRMHSTDYFFSHENMLDELCALFMENNYNDIVFQYAVAYALLDRNLDGFKTVTHLRKFAKVPRSYQEAYLLIWTKTHTDMIGLPNFISATTRKRFTKFVNAYNADSKPEELYEQFGDTYWFYYYFDITQ